MTGAEFLDEFDMAAQDIVTNTVLGHVLAERRVQHTIWGEQNHPDGTGRPCDMATADSQREACERAFREGWGSWSSILREEVAEALAESDPESLREELIQVAAVAVAWVEAIDRRVVSPPGVSSGGAAE